jgi:AraC-like DNA-binding protein
MKVIHRVSTDRFTISDLIRTAAERSLRIEPLSGTSQNLSTPIFSGRLLLCEVQPGLTASAFDVTYLSDHQIQVDTEPSLMCAVLLQGDDETMEVGGRWNIVRRRERPVLLGFSKTMTCRRTLRARQRSCGAGFVLKPAFFDRFGEQVTDDGLSALREFCCAELRTETLARSSRLLELATRSLDHPYNGHLGELFLESNTLSFVVEVTKLLEHERRIVAQIGRKHYDRVMEACEILDVNLVAPPRTLDLARQVGTNVTTLQANFRLVAGTTIFGYVRDQRLLMARALLFDHGLAIAEAGYRVGFSSPAAFTAAYRRRFGHAPGKETRGPAHGRGCL